MKTPRASAFAKLPNADMNILRKKSKAKPRSLGARILGIALLSFALIFTALYAVDYTWHEQNLFEELSMSSEILSDLLQHAVEEPMTRGNDEGTTEQFQSLARFGFVRIFLTNHQGDVTYSTLDRTLGENILSLYRSEKLRDSIRTALKTPITLSRFVSLDQRPFFAEVTTVTNEPSCHHCHGSSRRILGALVQLHDVSPRRDKLSEFHSQRSLLFLIGGALMLGSLLFYIKRNVVNRIRSIEGTTRKIMDGDLNAVFDVSGDDELARLSTHLSHMVQGRKEAERELAELNRNLEAVVRERTQELLERTRELEQANRRLREMDRMKSEFLSTVSHELKTPLTSVRGFANILSKSIRTKLLPELKDTAKPKVDREARRVKENLGILDSELDRLQELILEVIDMADLTSGKADWVIETVDLAGLAEERVEAFRSEAAAKGLGLEVICDKPPPPVDTDRERVGQLLDQLLDNAVKFTETGGIIVRLGMEEDGVLVEVRDTGPGIPPDELERVFDQFIQLGDQLTDKPSGTGLGLAICKEIATRLGGRIWAQSAPGRYASFFVTLPLNPPEDLGVSEPAHQQEEA